MGNSFIASIRAILFYVTTFVLAIPLFIFMVIVFPFVYLTDKYRSDRRHIAMSCPLRPERGRSSSLSTSFSTCLPASRPVLIPLLPMPQENNGARDEQHLGKA